MGKLLPPLPPLRPKIAFVAPTQDFSSGNEDLAVIRSFGMKALLANLAILPAAIVDAAGFEVATIMREVILESQETYVPVDTGDLSESGNSDEYVAGSGVGGIATLRAWFGESMGETAHARGVHDPYLYALEQHENTELHHPPLHTRTKEMAGHAFFRPGGPKYLETPFNNKAPSVAPRVGKAISETLTFSAPFADIAMEAGPATVVNPDAGGK